MDSTDEKFTPLIGYARTSTSDQKAGMDAQVRDLRAAAHAAAIKAGKAVVEADSIAAEMEIFQEQLSSVAAQRPQLDAAIRHVRKGEALVVTRLDRLARSVADLVKIQDKLARKGAQMRILALDLDTASPTGKLMVNLLGSIAEFERELMLERQREGIAKAKAEGKYVGRQPTARRKAGDVLRLRGEGKSAADIVKALGISRASVFRILAEAGDGGG